MWDRGRGVTRVRTATQLTAEAWATSHTAPLWVAVALLAVARADPFGVVWLAPGELLTAVAPGSRTQAVSRAIRQAVEAGWLEEGSNAGCLVVCRGA